MKVEIWSDFVCPFCYIGKRRFEQALKLFPEREQVEVHFRSFQLDPDVPPGSKQTVYEGLALKYGTTIQQARDMCERVAGQAKEAGLTFHFDTAVSANTFHAHRLHHFAAKMGKEKELAERLLQAHFSDSINIGDKARLLELAEEVGLEKAAAEQVLAGDDYGAEVKSDIEQAAKYGIRGVPFFLFNEKYAVSGAQPSEAFLQALHKAAEER
ncbi:DsbA family oxidoreductase [Halalkalibacter oceani]|uniref:DsbA family oxidoreductase n=1 Tax=Halalkalibacter oceani TaxID=1653776 RepID=A0A9X2DSB5_9BACI|nr:DsbA family oxidoreductase [Halalkalibacter oceani]MCM3714700.1 DsbA family oxidoreductase [Halalkalibacter oceani]